MLTADITSIFYCWLMYDFLDENGESPVEKGTPPRAHARSVLHTLCTTDGFVFLLFPGGGVFVGSRVTGAFPVTTDLIFCEILR